MPRGRRQCTATRWQTTCKPDADSKPYSLTPPAVDSRLRRRRSAGSVLPFCVALQHVATWCLVLQHVLPRCNGHAISQHVALQAHGNMCVRARRTVLQQDQPAERLRRRGSAPAVLLARIAASANAADRSDGEGSESWDSDGPACSAARRSSPEVLPLRLRTSDGRTLSFGVLLRAPVSELGVNECVRVPCAGRLLRYVRGGCA
jgi:hypothetical protein